MIRRLLMACAAAPLLAVAAFAHEPEGEPEAEAASDESDCFRNADIRGWGVIDENTIRVRINSQRQYALHTHMRARRVRFENAISVRSPSGWICTGREVGVEVHVGGSTPRVWVVDHVERLPPPTAAATPEQQEQ